MGFFETFDGAIQIIIILAFVLFIVSKFKKQSMKETLQSIIDLFEEGEK